MATQLHLEHDFTPAARSGFTAVQIGNALKAVNLLHGLKGFGPAANHVRQFDEVVGFDTYTGDGLRVVAAHDTSAVTLKMPRTWLNDVDEDAVRTRCIAIGIRQHTLDSVCF